MLAALHTQWNHMHTATSHDECDPLGIVLKVGHRCWQEGRHVCSGDGIVLQMAVHRWEAVVKRCFPPGLTRTNLRSSKIMVGFELFGPYPESIGGAIDGMADEPTDAEAFR